MKCIRWFDGKPYTYVGTYWDREVVRLCLKTGRKAGYLMRQAKVAEGHPPWAGTATMFSPGRLRRRPARSRCRSWCGVPHRGGASSIWWRSRASCLLGPRCRSDMLPRLKHVGF